MQKILLAFVSLSLTLSAAAQGTFIPLNGDGNIYLERLDIKFSKILPIQHTGDKSYYRGNAAKIAETLLLSNLRFNKTLQFQLQYLIDFQLMQNSQTLCTVDLTEQTFLIETLEE